MSASGQRHGGDRCGQRRLAVVNVTNRPNVHVRLGPLELFLCHDATPVSVAIWVGGCVVPMGRIELPTSPLPRECSATEPHGRNLLTVNGAGEGNRTLVVSLEGFCSTIELHPPGLLLPLPPGPG